MADKKVIKFFANWCGPCKIYAKTWEKVEAENNSDDIEFISINIEDDNTGYTTKFKIRSIPTTVLLQGDEVLNQKSGQLNKEELLQFINK